MKLGMIITQTDPETVFNGLRLALSSLQQGDEVCIFFREKASTSTRSTMPSST